MPPFLLNMPEPLKHQVGQLAELDQVSMTQWILLTIAEKVGERQATGNNNKPKVKRGPKLTQTAKGSEFTYEQNSKDGFWIESATGSRWDVPASHLKFARELIEEHGVIELGASRSQPKKGSLGDRLLQQFGVNNASYIVPILKDAGICEIETSKDGRSYSVNSTI